MDIWYSSNDSPFDRWRVCHRRPRVGSRTTQQQNFIGLAHGAINVEHGLAFGRRLDPYPLLDQAHVPRFKESAGSEHMLSQ